MDGPRVWFVTGTSTGFGRALAELVLEKGEAVVATARKASSLDGLVEKYSKDRVLPLKVDVTNEEDVKNAFAQAKKVFGRVDVVFNNAGYGEVGEFESIDEETARGVLETNFWGAVRVTRHALRFLREDNPAGRGGRLLQMSSMYGLAGSPMHPFYCASKFALEGMTESLAQELDPKWNIKVVLIEPGWFKTQGLANAVIPPRHPAYSSPDLPSNQLRAAWGTFDPPGDANKAVETFYRIAALPDPPLHFPVGEDAVSAVKQKIAQLEKALQEYGSWSVGLQEAK
ncbi:NAD-P-binding protein [Trametes coccinea BRFM310]|uniref:NAD-P-binding protein n=1 Tax=Trametes coccinea (strain BRFM310) TaxID=1353009 RepID=A0A1Y2IAM1_TRAC3|nr:NAD-P-binding protein [Trametes coccinea BRFM310]